MNAMERLVANAVFNRGAGYRSPYLDLPANADVTRLAELYVAAGTHRGDNAEHAELDRSAIELHVRMVAQVRWDDDAVIAALAVIEEHKAADRRERRKANDKKRRELRKIKRNAIYGGAS